ncbi:LacI family transcriptional regulator [Sphingomonas koreensis]|nr:LacI family transcriptional regulator [Sphingomonas koreensis]
MHLRRALPGCRSSLLNPDQRCWLPAVSRTLRGDRTVNAATRMRIEAIARPLNYTVDKHASPRRRGT